jgi:REP element-mobilizing transposase RayT
MAMKDYYAPFEFNHFYHVYNGANGNENIFIETKNYDFFLEKLNLYLTDYMDIWTYCLLPNHFHLLIKIGDERRLKRHTKFRNLGISIDQFISNQFRKLFISYTKSYNKAYGRNGGLFQKPFKRIRVENQNYLLMLVHYIHHNPIHHNFAEDYLDWKYSSYLAIASKSPTRISRSKVLELFVDLKRFKIYHSEMKNYNKINRFIIE